MRSARNLLLSLVFRCWKAILVATLAIYPTTEGKAQSRYEDRTTPESWAWARIKEGKPADFNVRCGTPPLDPRAGTERDWMNDCRSLSAAFLVDILTRAPWRDQVPFTGVSIVGARIIGDINLRNAKINRALLIEQSRIENDIFLDAARTDSIISFIASYVTGAFSAVQLHGEMSLILTNSQLKNDLSLTLANINGPVAMPGATIDGYLNADSLQAGALFMGSTEQSKANFQSVDLRGANIAGDIEMYGTTFKALNLYSAKVAGLVMLDGAALRGYLDATALQAGFLSMQSTKQNKTSFKGVSLNSAKIIASVMMDGTTLDGDLDAAALQTGSLFMRSTEQNKASFKGVSLNSAKVTGLIAMDGATVDGDLDAAALQAGFLSMQSTEQNKAGFQKVNLRSANIAGDLEMYGATFKAVNLNSAKVTGLVTMDDATLDGDLDAAALQAGFLSMQSTEQNKANFKRVSLNSAKVTGFVTLDGTTVDGDLDATSLQTGSLYMRSTAQNKASFKGINLNSAIITGLVAMDGATVDGDLNADSLQTGFLSMQSTEQNKAGFQKVNLRSANIAGDLEMYGATFTAINLNSAKVTGLVTMDDATLDGDLDAAALQAGFLSMQSTEQNKANFKRVSLNSAKVTGFVTLDGATVDGDLDAAALQAGFLFMRSTAQNKASFKRVSLNSAKVTGVVGMEGATVDGDIDAAALQAGFLFMQSTEQNKASFHIVNLRVANISGDIEMDGAALDGGLNAADLQVKASLFMHNVIATQPIDLAFAHIGGSLDIRGSTLAKLDASGAFIGGELRLGVWSETPTLWRTKDGEPGELFLVNTRISNLMDTENAWPSEGHLRLDGFTFARLGGFDGDTGPEMRSRGMKWWDGWVRRDPVYSPTPYEQLAAALVAAGDRDAADDIRYFGRERQRQTEKDWWPWIYSGILKYVAGYGIGDYTFIVLYWVIGISLVGGFYLFICVEKAREHGLPWCFGASLARLLPIIEINKAYTVFFHKPEENRFKACDSFVFAVIALLGWILGAILAAAVAGLTQKP